MKSYPFAWYVEGCVGYGTESVGYCLFSVFAVVAMLAVLLIPYSVLEREANQILLIQESCHSHKLQQILDRLKLKGYTDPRY